MIENTKPNWEVPAPERVIGGIKAVRDTGETNMFDYNAVVAIASRLGYDETVAWMAENKSKYARGIFFGFRTEEQE